MRGTQLDTVKCEDLLKPNPTGGLIQLPHRKVAARIPHQPQCAHWGSFPQGALLSFVVDIEISNISYAKVGDYTEFACFSTTFANCKKITPSRLARRNFSHFMTQNRFLTLLLSKKPLLSSILD